MGRAMLIICAGVLISMGFVVISTSNTGKMLTQQNVSYAEYTMAKNAAHTAIQIAMQKINKDTSWAKKHDYAKPWKTTVQGLPIELHIDLDESPDYWEPDELRFYSRAKYKNSHVLVESLYLKQPFSSLVPDFKSALTFATTKDKFKFEYGGSVKIDGNPPSDAGCSDLKPGITTIDADLNDFEKDGNAAIIAGDPEVTQDTTLSYQPTDQMIERLYNTIGQLDGAVKLSTSSGSPLNKSSLTPYGCGDNLQGLGCADKPGVFVVEDQLKITGGKIEGYGILIVRSDADMIAIDESTGAELDLAGNFEFNGLVVFENAVNFGSAGTPTINGSVLIGNTNTLEGKMQINMTGNGTIQYDCRGENYAKMAAANAIQQLKYTRLVSTENLRRN